MNSKLIKTYIVSAYQWSASIAIEHLVANLPMGANAAAIIAENSTGNVLAYVASGDFFDDMREGQVDFIRAARSPGSTLKTSGQLTSDIPHETHALSIQTRFIAILQLHPINY